MTRYIDADALNYVRVRIAHEDGTIGGYNAVVPSSEIKNAPTIDAVPVIRCKDCKHRPHKDERGHIVPVEEDEECSPCPCVDDGDWYYNYIPKDDWYCANGELKDSTAEVRRQLKETEQRKEMERKK